MWISGLMAKNYANNPGNFLLTESAENLQEFCHQSTFFGFHFTTFSQWELKFLNSFMTSFLNHIVIKLPIHFFQ